MAKRVKKCRKGTHAVVTTCKGKIVGCYSTKSNARAHRKAGQRVKKYPFKRYAK